MKSLKVIILSEIIFFPFKKAGAHLQCLCNIFAKFQVICLKTVGGVDYTDSVYGQGKISMCLKAVIFFKNDINLFKTAHVHLQYIYNICVKFQRNCLKAAGGVDYINFESDRWMDRQKFCQKDLFLFKKAGAYLQSVCNIYAKFQVICFTTVGGVDYTNCLYGKK